MAVIKSKKSKAEPLIPPMPVAQAPAVAPVTPDPKPVVIVSAPTVAPETVKTAAVTPPVATPSAPALYRIKATKCVSHYGAMIWLKKGEIVNEAGYGKDGIARLLDAGAELEKI